MMEAANEACRNIIKNYDVMEPGKPDHYASMKAQLAAKGMVLLAIQEISAIDPAEVLARLRPRCAECDCDDGNCSWIVSAPDAVVRLGEAARRHLAWIDYDFPSGVREQELAARNALRTALAEIGCK